MKKFFKITGYALLFLASLTGIYLLAAYILSRIGIEKEAVTTEDVSIYILTNGVHTDLVLPVKNPHMDWSNQIRFEHTLGKDSLMQYVGFGWGDKGFFLETPAWADLKFSTAFKAAFGLSPSAMHTTFYKNMKEGKDCRKIPMSGGQYARLVQYIRRSFKPDSDGNVIHINTTVHYGRDDAFYEAVGRCNLFNNCNTWANDGLKACGQKAGLWTPFQTGIFYHYKAE